LYVPLHIIERLEAHAKALGKSRDEFAAELMGRAMQNSYGMRDKHLRDAYGVSDVPQGAEQGEPLHGD
jgi:hypothetical protein